MCKLFIATNTSKLKVSQLKKLIHAVKEPLTKTNDDGFGWAAHSDKGIFGERYSNELNKGLFIDLRRFYNARPGPYDSKLFMKLYDSFGRQGKLKGGLVVHGRTSTNAVNLLNTHPIVNDSHALVHNGVVENVGKTVTRRTTNDSEFILQHYSEGGIDQVSASVEGYYACGILEKDTGNTIVIKDSTAPLVAAWVEELSTYFFASSHDVILEALKALKMQAAIEEVKTNQHLVFNVAGELIAQTEFTPRKRSYGATDYRSLGRSAGQDSSWFDDYTSQRWGTGGNTSDIPAYREDAYEIYDATGRKISESEYEQLTADKMALCQWYQNGRRVG